MCKRQTGERFVNTITSRTMKQVLSLGVRFVAVGYYSLSSELVCTTLTPLCELGS